jgi:hypothetical protein
VDAMKAKFMSRLSVFHPLLYCRGRSQLIQIFHVKIAMDIVFQRIKIELK